MTNITSPLTNAFFDSALPVKNPLLLTFGLSCLLGAYKVTKHLHEINADWLGIGKEKQVLDYHHSKWMDCLIINCATLALNRLISPFLNTEIPSQFSYISSWVSNCIIARYISNWGIKNESQKLTLKNIIFLETALLAEIALFGGAFFVGTKICEN